MLGKKADKNKDKEAAQPSKTKAPAGRKATSASVIAVDLNILGNLISDGYIDINGHIEGNVKCDSLTIRPEGSVHGDIVAASVQVHGNVNGVIKARNVHLASTARVTGVIIHETMSVDDGAYIDGQCKSSDRHAFKDMSSSSHDDDAPRMEILESTTSNVRLLAEKK